jgi:hypothetical protein
MRSRKVCRNLPGSALTNEELDRSTWDRFGPIASGWPRSKKEELHDAHIPPSKAQLKQLLQQVCPGMAKLI